MGDGRLAQGQGRGEVEANEWRRTWGVISRGKASRFDDATGEPLEAAHLAPGREAGKDESVIGEPRQAPQHVTCGV